MTKISNKDTPSALYRIQISNIASRMSDLVDETKNNPLQNMTAFNQFEIDFNLLEQYAYSGCKAMDSARSIKEEDSATENTTQLMQKLVLTKNEASDLVENDPNLTLDKRVF